MHIIGASGHAKVIVEILKLNNNSISGVWDDNVKLKRFLDFEINGNIAGFKNVNHAPTLIAIGNNKVRKSIAEQIISAFGIALHPSCVVSSSSILGEGTVVMSNASINAGCKIGKHVIINTNASVDHDCEIDDFVHISPQVGLAGNVQVGEGTHIGIGACVIPGIIIGRWATIGAGAVVLKNIPDYAVVVGNPARIIKTIQN